MAPSSRTRTILLIVAFFVVCPQAHAAAKKPYVVYMGAHSHGPNPTQEDYELVAVSHHHFLASYLGSLESAKDAIFATYKKHINGFAAMLDEEQAAEIAKHPNVVSVFLSKGRKMQTTRSWDFMLVQKDGAVRPWSIWSKASFGEDAIIANLDTGIWPESESFTDYDYGAIPSRWRGECEGGPNFKCNKKVIGARVYYRGYLAAGGVINATNRSTRDTVGHGTHTLSTAGGNFVPGGANISGTIIGSPKGGSPRARLAAYKVCWDKIHDGECFDPDILAAFDDAIHDGVDVISVSLGGDTVDYFNDGIAIGSFHAVNHGIPVICSAGNSGPDAGTVSNVAPWIITVGASTLDREMVSYVKLGNEVKLRGASLAPALGEKERLYPLITGEEGRSGNVSSAFEAMLCYPGTLDPRKVKGKIVVCLRGDTDRVDKGYQVMKAGGVGMILCDNDKFSTDSEMDPDAHFLPALLVNYEDGVKVFNYINSTKNPMGYITPVQVELNQKPNPQMASFSSTGPNKITPQIIKPDITAPGVNIVAAISAVFNPTGEPYDNRKFPYYIMSGTSMSAPHVSGITGLLKTLYPEWSPAALRSAIMTTARTRDNSRHPIQDFSGNKANPFNYGSGHVRPNEATNPGLVYDLSTKDYLDFLCATGYNQTVIRLFQGFRRYNCSESATIYDLNYPSISVPKLAVGQTVVLKRRVKYVGGSPGMNTTYKAVVRQPLGVRVNLEPKSLTFEKKGEERSFKVFVKAVVKGLDYQFGSLVWSDGTHFVRSPIAVSTA